MNVFNKILYSVLLVVVMSFCYSCHERKQEQWQHEVIQAEAEFAAMAGKEGVGKAFIYYAADSAVLLRSNKLIKGKKAITEAYSRYNSDSIKLSWKPDFVEVSASGDLAYTYGQYIISVMDSTGQVKSDTGIFHTVWKRQPDGQWRFVWD